MARAARSFEVRARNYDDFETYVVRSSTSVSGAPTALMGVAKCYANFQEELEFESAFNQDMSWRSTLRGPLSRFTKLEKLTTLSSLEDLVDSKYLRRRCALTHQSWTPNYFAPYEIFEVAGRTFRPKSLSMDSVNGEDFASVISNIRGGEAVVASRFADLKYLRLSFSETVNMLEVEGTWDVFIRSITGLETLSLDFKSFYSPKMLKEPESFPQKVIKLFLSQDYPRLRRLDLAYTLMTETDFLGFSERHRHSLTSLRLHRWSMPVDPSSGLPTGSAIRAFYRVGQIEGLRLREVYLENEFSNRADGEGWTARSMAMQGLVRDEDRDEGVRLRLEAYLRKDRGVGDGVVGTKGPGGGDGDSGVPCFPLPVTAEEIAAAKTGKQLGELDALPFQRGCGDGSFEWWEYMLPLHSL